MPGKHRMLSVMRKLFVFTLALYLINYISGCDLMIIILICEHLLMTVTLLCVIWNGINGNKKHKNLKLQRVINGCVAYCVFSIIALVLFYYGNVVTVQSQPLKCYAFYSCFLKFCLALNSYKMYNI